MYLIVLVFSGFFFCSDFFFFILFHQLLKLGVHLEKQEFSALHDEVCKEGKQLNIKDFFNFVQHKDSDVRSIAKRLRRTLKSSASIKGLQATFAELDIDHTGTVTRRRFTKIFRIWTLS